MNSRKNGVALLQLSTAKVILFFFVCHNGVPCHIGSILVPGRRGGARLHTINTYPGTAHCTLPVNTVQLPTVHCIQRLQQKNRSATWRVTRWFEISNFENSASRMRACACVTPFWVCSTVNSRWNTITVHCIRKLTGTVVVYSRALYAYCLLQWTER